MVNSTKMSTSPEPSVCSGFTSFLSLFLGFIRLVVSVVGKYRLVDKRSTVSPLLVPKPGDNPKVWDLVEEETVGLEVDLRTGDYERELEAPFYHCWCPGWGDVFLPKS